MKNRSVLARHRLRCALVIGLMLVAGFSSCAQVDSCQIPISYTGLLDQNGQMVCSLNHGRLSCVGDGVFSFVERNEVSSDAPGRLHVRNFDGKKVEISLPNGWELERVYLPRQSTPGTCSAVELPEHSLLSIYKGDRHRLITKTGKDVIAPSENRIFGYSQYGFYLFKFMEEHGVSGVFDKPFFAFDPSTGRKYFGRDVGRFNFDQSINVHRVETLGEQVMRVNRLKGKYQSIRMSPPLAPDEEYLLLQDNHIDGWVDDLAVVECFLPGKPSQYGLINRRYQFVLPPRYSKLKQLRGKSYIAQMGVDEAFEVVDSTGKRMISLPPDTQDVLASDDLLLCIHKVDKPGKPYGVSLVDLNGKILHTVSDCKVQTFSHGIAVLETKYFDSFWHNKGLSVLTRDGITARDIQGYYLIPVSSTRLLSRSMGLDFSLYYWCNPAGGMRKEMQFVHLLEQRDFIGMTRADLESELSKPDGPDGIYILQDDKSKKNFNGFELRYNDDKVDAWRWVNMRDGRVASGAWIDKNVLVDWEPFCGSDRYSLVDWSTVKIEPKILTSKVE